MFVVLLLHSYLIVYGNGEALIMSFSFTIYLKSWDGLSQKITHSRQAQYNSNSCDTQHRIETSVALTQLHSPVHVGTLATLFDEVYGDHSR
jgi:hypothetical protein